MTTTDYAGLIERLRGACVGHPHAKIEWPHRLLREAADALAALLGEVERLREHVATATDPAYLASALERVGVVDKEWKDRAEKAERERNALIEALTPSADTKAAYIGEFRMGVTLYHPKTGEEDYRSVQVPWTTIKEIMAAIRSRTKERDLQSLIDASKARVAAMAPEERAAMYQAQRESFARAMAPCEHGVSDWEECPQCRSRTSKEG